MSIRITRGMRNLVVIHALFCELLFFELKREKDFPLDKACVLEKLIKHGFLKQHYGPIGEIRFEIDDGCLVPVSSEHGYVIRLSDEQEAQTDWLREALIERGQPLPTGEDVLVHIFGPKLGELLDFHRSIIEYREEFGAYHEVPDTPVIMRKRWCGMRFEIVVDTIAVIDDEKVLMGLAS